MQQNRGICASQNQTKSDQQTGVLKAPYWLLASWRWNTSFSSVIFFRIVIGNSRIVSVKNLTPKEIEHHVSLLRTSSGIKVTKLKKWWHTDNPTIQGNWNPFLNK